MSTELSSWFPYEWRPYQKDCFNAIADNYLNHNITEQMVVQGTGLGKRSQAVQISNVPIFHDKPILFLAHNEELINQAVADFELCHGFGNVGIIKGKQFDIGKKIIVASPQTLVNRLNKISPDHFGLVLIDECFPSGTKVDNKNIEDIKIGDIITSFNHKTNMIEDQMVINTFKKKAPKYLYNFGEFSCTSNHPIFIKDIGYCIAKEIYLAYICHTSMCYLYDLYLFKYLHKLWKKFQSSKSKKNLFRSVRTKQKAKIKSKSRTKLSKLWNSFWLGNLERRKRNDNKTEKDIHSYDFKRFWMLFRKMQKGISERNLWKETCGIQQKTCICKNEEKQSYDESRNNCKSKKGIKRKNFSFSWWKWSIDKTTIEDSRNNRSSNGICNKNKRTNFRRKITSISLQSRFGLSRSKTLNRNRRKDSSIEALEILRQKENKCFEFSRLDCNKIHKRRSGSRSRKGNKINYVYNIEVAKNNNYFVEGILVHNCHRYMSKTYLKCVRHFNHTLRVGWTATPHRLDNLSLSNLFEKIVFEYNLDEGIRDKYLCELDAIKVKTQIEFGTIHKSMGDFNQKELDEKVDTPSRNNLIAAKYKEYALGRQFVAFCVTKKHAHNLADKFKLHGLNVAVLTSDTIDRKGMDNNLRAKKLDGIINVNILVEGWDYSEIGCVIDAAPTTSLTRYLQRIGRGTRLKSPEFVEKFGQNCIILDIIDNTGKHKVVNTWELDRGKKADEKTFITTEKRDKIREVEEARERKFEANIIADTRVNLLKLPKFMQSGSPKMLEEATLPQINFLKSLGIYDDTIEYTKALANEAISNSPAKGWQVSKLKTWGYDVSNEPTLGQFQKVQQSRELKDKFKIK